MVVNSVPSKMFTTSFINIDNNNRLPIFTLQFADSLNNTRPIDIGWTLSASLNVPSGLKTAYAMGYSTSADGIVTFTLSNADSTSFKQEFGNSACSLSVKGFNYNTNKAIDLTFSKVVLLGNQNDTFYTNTVPTASTVKILPAIQTVVAGVQTSLQFQLVASDGKLYRQAQTNGWYTSASSAISLTNSNGFTVSILNGNMFGSYIINLMNTVVGTYTFQIKF